MSLHRLMRTPKKSGTKMTRFQMNYGRRCSPWRWFVIDVWLMVHRTERRRLQHLSWNYLPHWSSLRGQWIEKLKKSKSLSAWFLGVIWYSTFSPKFKSRIRLQAASTLLHLSTIETFATAIAPKFIRLACVIQVPNFTWILNRMLADFWH